MTKKQLKSIKNKLTKLAESSNTPDYYKLLVKAVFDYITELEEENWEYETLQEIGDRREHRSNFLKDFHREFGNNVYPDYDEIYKRYDDMKERMKKAQKCIDKHAQHFYTEELWEAKELLDNKWG